jgi:hypothetical protein
MKLRLTVLATAVAALAGPGTASAAELDVEPSLPCYGSEHRVELVGTGFSENASVTVTREGEQLGVLQANGTGAFRTGLRLGQRNGRRTSTYTATDTSDPMLTASEQITVSETDVRLRPQTGAPGRRVRISAVGFTAGGKRLWAHVTRAERTRHISVGRLKGACKRITKRRRLLPRDAQVGVYNVQFDAFREYVPRRPQSVTYTITVRPVGRPAIN